SSTQINIAWADNSDHETGYTIYRSDNGGPLVVVGTTGADETRFEDQTASEGTPFVYYVEANGGTGDSGGAGDGPQGSSASDPVDPATRPTIAIGSSA